MRKYFCFFKIDKFDLDKKRIKKTVEICNFSNLRNLENDKGFVEAQNGKFFRKGKKDSWKNELTPELQKK